jgi:hypothetical protein
MSQEIQEKYYLETKIPIAKTTGISSSKREIYLLIKEAFCPSIERI